MRIFPASRESRSELLLAALGAYLLGVPVIGICSKFLTALLGWDDLGRTSNGAQLAVRSEQAHLYSALGFGYVLCLLALFLLLAAFREKRLRRAALVIAVLGVVFLVIVFYPLTQTVRTR
jgi:hypothetical protein